MYNVLFSDLSQELYKYLVKEVIDGRLVNKCTICGRCAQDRGNMRKHVENIHFPDRFTYPCKYCGLYFGTRNKLNNHMTTQHK